MKKIYITVQELLMLCISLILIGVILGNNQFINDRLVNLFVLVSVIQLPLIILIKVVRRTNT